MEGMLLSERVQLIEEGNRLALTRAITLVENERGDWEGVLDQLYGSTGRAYRIGITGPPGAGKSTLTQKLIASYRTEGKRVGVIAVDPTSPYTGGAILGDRVRMQSVSMDEGVFIRSMATRGSLGGLAVKAGDVADLLDAAGYDIVLIETVGVGQSELDIAEATDTTVVVLVPESGDSIQAMKAGLMEIADIFVMNKADRDGSDQAVSALKTILTMRITHAEREWIPEVVRTVGTTGDGINDLVNRIRTHRDFQLEHDFLSERRAEREGRRLRRLAERFLHQNFWTEDREKHFSELIGAVVSRDLSPGKAARILSEKMDEVS